MIYINPIIPKAGLCNKLFVWARAEVLAKKLCGRMFAPRFSRLASVGPWLRGERDKRHYLNQFINYGYVGYWERLYAELRLKHIDSEEYSGEDNVIVDVCLHDVSTQDGFFIPFLEEHDYIVNRLRQIVSPSILAATDCVENGSFIAVHIRRGDFAFINSCVSDDWYIRMIDHALKLVGNTNFPIRIFSDEKPVRLKRILSMYPGAVLQPKAPAIQDLLMLAKGCVNICTSGSSFSMWSVYIGQMPSIWDESQQPPKMYIGAENYIQKA